ncbi:MAG TPA: phosphotransferase [Verrucomicrobiae bacterium]|nr:phosphotransferase [Verrucomicrobiae bacterium]
MFLTVSNLAHYLIGSGRISSESVVSGDFLAMEAGRRNRNYKVMRQKGPGLFIKQVSSPDPQAITTLQREAVCYQIVSSNPALARLAALTPKYVAYDPKRHVLIVELLPGEESLNAHHKRLGEFPVELGRTLGRSLGACHSEAGRLFLDQAPPAVLPRQTPWILSFHSSNPASIGSLSGGNQQLWSLLRQFPDFTRHLEELRAGWCHNALIHGDIKWDNCLVYQGPDGKPAFRIVDWELADFGDADWDAGAMLQAYLVYWMLSLPQQTGTFPEEWIRKSPVQLEAMHPSIQAFWKSYVGARGLDPSAARTALRRCVQYCAARMVQTAYEHLAFSPQASGSGILLLQTSLNLLRDPEGATRELFGL